MRGHDSGGLNTDMHRGVDGPVVKQGIALLRHACKEARVGVEARVKEESRGRAEGPGKAGLECCILAIVIVHNDAGAAGAEGAVWSAARKRAWKSGEGEGERLSLEEKSTGEMALGADGECEKKSRGDGIVLLSSVSRAASV